MPMNPIRHLLAPAIALLLGAAAATPALAASSAASSASDSLSTSVGSVSDSFRGSSESSDQPNRTADGDYRVVEVAALDERPGMLQLMLQPAGDQGEPFALILPHQAAENGGLAVGALVHAQNRPYGVEFARADNRQAFFLVLDDDWYRELASNPVTL
jgi:hypothetical protein